MYNLLKKKRITGALEKIFNHLLLNVFYLKNQGLYYGKTGCLLFFAHFAKLYNDEVTDEVVSEIIDDIFASVVNIQELGIPNGLCGIGWGVEYMIQNQLMEGDTDDVLVNLDRVIYSKEIKTVASCPDFSDILKYITVRLTSCCGESKNLPFPRDYLSELYQTAKKQADIQDFAMGNEVNILGEILEKGRFRRGPVSLTPEMTGQASIDKFPLVLLSLHNGISGFGIKLIIENSNNLP